MNPPGRSLSTAHLRRAMRFWATGVTIVSSRFEDTRHGMTVNSFTSVSLEPPLVLVALEKRTRTHGLVRQSGVYAVTILRADQVEVSNRFAGFDTEQKNRYLGLETFEMETGSPLLKEGLAWFDCHVVADYEGGTHTIFLAEVIALRACDDEQGTSPPKTGPLLYYDRTYRRLER